jgi:hypothetical protein
LIPVTDLYARPPTFIAITTDEPLELDEEELLELDELELEELLLELDELELEELLLELDELLLELDELELEELLLELDELELDELLLELDELELEELLLELDELELEELLLELDELELEELLLELDELELEELLLELVFPEELLDEPPITTGLPEELDELLEGLPVELEEELDELLEGLPVELEEELEDTAATGLPDELLELLLMGAPPAGNPDEEELDELLICPLLRRGLSSPSAPSAAGLPPQPLNIRLTIKAASVTFFGRSIRLVITVNILHHLVNLVSPYGRCQRVVNNS